MKSKRFHEECRRADPVDGYLGGILGSSALMIGAVMVKKKKRTMTNLFFRLKWPKDRHAFWMGIGIGALGVSLAAFYYGGHRLFDSLGIYGIPMVIGDDPGETYRQLRDAGRIPSLKNTSDVWVSGRDLQLHRSGSLIRAVPVQEGRRRFHKTAVQHTSGENFRLYPGQTYSPLAGYSSWRPTFCSRSSTVHWSPPVSLRLSPRSSGS